MEINTLLGNRKYFVGEISYALISSIFFGIMITASVLGFLKSYNGVLAILVTLGVILGTLYLYLRTDTESLLHTILSRKRTSRYYTFLQILTFTVSISVLFYIILLPITRWPRSPMGDALFWDTAAYHFPKAIDLFKTGSIWDLSTPFGEYPFGHESLLSFSMLFSGNEMYFGIVHAVLGLYFCLNVWLLLCRYSNLSQSLCLFLSVGLLTVGLLHSSHTFNVNLFEIEDPFKLLYYQFTLVGQNDLLLGSAILAVILHAPIGKDANRLMSHPVGLSIAAAIALSTKPNSILVVLFALVLWLVTDLRRKQLNVDKLFGVLGILALGLIWAIRNLLTIGVVFGAGSNMMRWSIGYNLTNPFLYNITPSFYLLFTVLAVMIVASLNWKIFKKTGGAIVLTLFFLFIVWIFTPATAFHVFTNVQSELQWRLGISFLSFAIVIFILLFEPVLNRLWIAFSSKMNILIIASLICVFGTYEFFRKMEWLYKDVPSNTIIIEDHFRTSVGSGGYYSAYDYVRKNIRNSVIQFANCQPYYLYGPGFTNTPMYPGYPSGYSQLVKHPNPDYFIVLKSSYKFLNTYGQFPDSISSPSWLSRWDLIYQDTVGRVFKKK